MLKQISCIQVNFFLNLRRNFDLIFFGRLYVFCISSSVSEVRTLVTCIQPVLSLLCDFFLKYTRNFSLVIFFSQAKSHRINCKSLILFLLIKTYLNSIQMFVIFFFHIFILFTRFYTLFKIIGKHNPMYGGP